MSETVSKTVSKTTLAEVIARALFDTEYQKALLADPEATLVAAGLEPKPEWIAKIRTLDPKQMARATKKVEKSFFDSANTPK